VDPGNRTVKSSETGLAATFFFHGCYRLLLLDLICVINTPNVTAVGLKSRGTDRAYGIQTFCSVMCHFDWFITSAFDILPFLLNFAGGFWAILAVMLVEGCLLRETIVLYVWRYALALSLSVVVFCLVMFGHNFLFILWLLLYTICHWPTCFAFVTLGLQGLGSNTNGVLWLLPALGSLHLWWNQVHIVKSISYNQLHFCVVLKEFFPSLYPNNVNFANKCCSDERYMQFQVDGHLQYKCSTCRGESYQVCVSFIVKSFIFVCCLIIYLSSSSGLLWMRI